MSEITRESLQQRYADLVDAELLRLLRAHSLTELAREVALAELAGRGILAEAALAADAAPAELQVDAELDFPADEFARNPQAPRAPTSAMTRKSAAAEKRRGRVWNVLWFGYVSFVGLIIVLDLVGRLTGLRAAYVSVVKMLTLAMMTAGLVGIVGWRLRRAWLHPLLWVACLAVNLAWLGSECLESWNELGTAGDDLPIILAGTAIVVALYLPLFWGLLRYAFTSTSIWRGSRREADATQA
ncbi:MAG: hypothetical protein BGP24_22950 [Lysobacterales bacterium 69-70]|nr:hypothetical protein [Xanthomonadaceae bacterium]ODU34249.1 MAG: hypothetical protein ABS97_09130 [Xanthomonadaceae bacterium SCN 69-320]ODV18493.1 MAG: hypothetical protein ABT27_13315 [Xanthomonadaceae bacterium SCN 69-25]OJY96156.1 MAG: hypothetical protein BGP24_22950 [Xanthomonadales bacterium 69-70]